MDILCVSLNVLVCVKLNNGTVRHYIVSYIKSLAAAIVAGELLPEASSSQGLRIDQTDGNQNKGVRLHQTPN